MTEFYRAWEPVLRGFKKAYEEWCLKQNIECADVVDWHPSGYLEVTVKMSDNTLMIYEFIGDRCYQVNRINTNLISKKQRADRSLSAELLHYTFRNKNFKIYTQ